MTEFICEEMQKLRDYLDANGIEWEDCSSCGGGWWMCRTHFYLRDKHYSVINGVGSWGGVMSMDGINHGQLELMVDENEPEGFLTADFIIDRMRKRW